MIISKTIRVGPSAQISFTGPQNTQNLTGLTVYGRSAQNGTPSPENPVAIESVADSGSITLAVVIGGSTNTVLISLANGLRGIPYKEPTGGRYLVTQDGDYLTTQDGDRLKTL